MKRVLFILLLAGLGAVITINTACEMEPNEECLQEDFCDGEKQVTACCTDGTDCYYTYLGVNYPDTPEGLADLTKALDCVNTKSVSIDGENDDMMYRLQVMLEEARKLSSK